MATPQKLCAYHDKLADVRARQLSPEPPQQEWEQILKTKSFGGYHAENNICHVLGDLKYIKTLNENRLQNSQCELPYLDKNWADFEDSDHTQFLTDKGGFYIVRKPLFRAFQCV